MLKLCIHMDNELLYCGNENLTTCSYSFLYLSIFLSFKAKFVSQFSPELCKLDSSNMVYICRLSDCNMGLRLRVMALIFLFLSIFFFLSLYYMLTLQFLCWSFLCLFFPSFKAKFVSQFSPELCKLESSNMVYICRMSDCIVGWRLRVMASIFLFLSIFLSFTILHVNIKILWGVFRNF